MDVRYALLWIGLAGGALAVLGGVAGWYPLTSAGVILLLCALLLLPWVSERRS